MTACYYITFYVQFCKAFNRFFAISSPIRYMKWFSMNNTKFILAFAILCGLFHGVFYFFPGCNVYYSISYLGWDYTEGSCYDIMAVYIDLYIGCTIIGITMLIDLTTLYLVLKHRLSTKNNKNVNFFIQAFSTSILYTTMIISTQILSYLNNNKWYIFITSTMSWELCHVVDG